MTWIKLHKLPVVLFVILTISVIKLIWIKALKMLLFQNIISKNFLECMGHIFSFLPNVNIGLDTQIL